MSSLVLNTTMGTPPGGLSDVLERRVHRDVGRLDTPKHHQERFAPSRLLHARYHVLDVVACPQFDVLVVRFSREYSTALADGDAALARFRRLVDRVEATKRAKKVPFRAISFVIAAVRVSCRVDVADRPEVDVRLRTRKFSLPMVSPKVL